MTPAVHTLGRLLCLLAALCTVNAHLFVGQGVAWITMIQDRTPQLGLQEAIADTLSGEHPCSRCLVLAEEREAQQEENPVPESRPAAKFTPPEQSSAPRAHFVTATSQCPATEARSHQAKRCDDIPVPPPRLA